MNQYCHPIDGKRFPFVKKFTQGGFYYIYDVNTNQFVEVEEGVYNLIDSCSTSSSHNESPQAIKSLEKIHHAQESHELFSNFRPKQVLMGMRTAGHIKDFHNKNFNQLLLELTTGCNLNCSYCRASGKYAASDSRIPNMSWKTLINVVDYFLENSLNTSYPSISFYGGEPLIRFGIIKDTVDYVRKKGKADRYNFSLTINGTLLNKDIAVFFIDHDFSVNVSIDGPEIVHDRYRRYKGNRGSFHTIMNNMRLLKNLSPRYYAEKVSITCVLAPPYESLSEILDFFSTNEIIHELRLKGKIRASRVNTRETNFIEDFGLESSIAQFPEVLEYLEQRTKAAFLAHDLSLLTIERMHLNSILHNLARRTNYRLYDYIPPLGACHPGLKRIFVKTNGDFFICERSGDDYKIGHVDKGLDYESIAVYYRKLEEVLKGCEKCWALLHCERCWVRLGNLDEFKGEKKEKFCQSQKNSIEKAFKLYVSLLKEDPECLKVLRNSA